MLVEHAIFTSLSTQRGAGYQLVAQSPGIRDEEARALAVWGPSHESLVDDPAVVQSVNHFVLPTGRVCVSRSQRAGTEYSGRGGDRVYTNCLVVESAHFARFGSNPFALITAALAVGVIEPQLDPPAKLEPFSLPGRATRFDAEAIDAAISAWSPNWLAAVVEAILTEPCLALMSRGDGRMLMSAIVNCFPPNCRSEITFATGLKYSPRRPFRVVCLPADESEARRLTRSFDVSVLHIDSLPPGMHGCRRGWSNWLFERFVDRDYRALTRSLEECPSNVGLEQLDAWGQQQSRQHSTHFATTARYDSHVPDEEGRGSTADDCPSEHKAARKGAFGRREPAHIRSQSATRDSAGVEKSSAQAQSAAQAVAAQVLAELATAPSDVLGQQHPEVVGELETLDDLVFEAISGKKDALARLQQLWPQLLVRLGPAMVEESRAQYIRHALSVWRECIDGEELHRPDQAIRALDVMTLLFAE